VVGGAPADMGEITSKHSLKGRGGGFGTTRCERKNKHALKGHGRGLVYQMRKNEQTSIERSWWGHQQMWEKEEASTR
jgi:hypothetical protein